MALYRIQEITQTLLRFQHQLFADIETMCLDAALLHAKHFCDLDTLEAKPQQRTDSGLRRREFGKALQQFLDKLWMRRLELCIELLPVYRLTRQVLDPVA